MMKQYFEIKDKYKYYLIFFRLGDFYELFFDDALIASKELDLVLTGRECGMDEKAPMCGVPFHSAESYITKLVAKNYKVAICEQIGDPKETKTILKREVVRIVTPGTVTDVNALDESKNNYIMCIFDGVEGMGITACDVTTGEFFTTSLKGEEESRIKDEIAKYNPSEIICNEKFKKNNPNIEKLFNVTVSEYYDWAFEWTVAKRKLTEHFSVLNLDGFGLNNVYAICASGALMEYLAETQKNSLAHISSIKNYKRDNFMVLDISSRKNLELTETIRDRSKRGSLLWLLDKTKTAMGSRLLRKWIEQPLIEVEEIHDRLDAVEELKNESLNRAELKDYLKTILDIERLTSRIIYKTANARDLIALKNSLKSLPDIKHLLKSFSSDKLAQIRDSLDTLDDLYQIIENAIVEEPPFSTREGNMIKTGYDQQLDKYHEAKSHGTDWLQDLEKKERESTGIKSLKIKFNKVFGYYIEVTNSYKNLVPEHYIRRQTLANAERYIIPELKQIEDAILGADEKIIELEYKLFSEIRDKMAKEVNRIQSTALNMSNLDTLQSLAEVAEIYNYTKPIVDNESIIDIREGRHAVVEQTRTDAFIPNDIYLDGEDFTLSIITGPNMAGKSTYMRQTALIVLMAQLGSFVPADYAKIGVVDRIFTRVGASDDLATGQSTFMVEMTELANILHNATKNSLLILDEIGRGTSTFDGLSIAWSTLEHIANQIVAKTLFATHYHELTELEGKIDGVKNYCISVEEQGDNIIFLRKIVCGGANNSYGIQVASLAGLPQGVINRAKEILHVLKESDINQPNLDTQKPVLEFPKKQTDDREENKTEKDVIEALKNLDVDSLSAKESLQILYDLCNKIKG